MAIVQTSAPAAEPLTLEEAKTFLQIDADITDEDDLIRLVLIPAARAAAEHRTACALIQRTYRHTADCFAGRVLALEVSPLVSVQSVQYLDLAEAWQTVDPTVYVVDTDTQPGRVLLRQNEVWPQHASQPACVRVSFTAGFAAEAEAVPPGLRHWMLMRIKGCWDHRSESVEVLRGRMERPSFVDGLLDPYRVVVA